MDDHTDKLRKKNPCLKCGCKLIDVKHKTIQMYDMGRHKMEVYCYCCKCGFKGPIVVDRFKDLDEAIGRAFLLWNQYMQQ